MGISKTKNGSYRLRVYIPDDVQGKLGIGKRFEKRFKTRREAKEAEIKLAVDIENARLGRFSTLSQKADYKMTLIKAKNYFDSLEKLLNENDYESVLKSLSENKETYGIYSRFSKIEEQEGRKIVNTTDLNQIEFDNLIKNSIFPQIQKVILEKLYKIQNIGNVAG